MNKYKNQAAQQQHSCGTIAVYESSRFILWNGIQLGQNDPEVEKLSVIQKPYLGFVKEEIGNIFPDDVVGGSQMDAKVFDHRLWHTWTDTQIETKFLSACKFLRKTCNQALATKYRKLVRRIQGDSVELCKKVDSSPKLVWQLNIKKYMTMKDDKKQLILPSNLRKVILSAALPPFGIAMGEFFQ